MFLYRVISKDNTGIENKPWIGINTFKYDDHKKYLHFYFFPEHAEFLQKNKYKNEGIILRCNIPVELLEFGIGLYNWHHNFRKEPFLEARIECDKFKEEFIIDKKDKIDNSWKKPLLYRRYVNNCLYDHIPYFYVDRYNNIIAIKQDFDFNYYIYEGYPNIQKQKLIYLKRLFLHLNERIEKTKEKRLIK